MRSLHSSSATLADTDGDMQAKSKEGHVDEAGRSLQHYGYEPQDTPQAPQMHSAMSHQQTNPPYRETPTAPPRYSDPLVRKGFTRPAPDLHDRMMEADPEAIAAMAEPCSIPVDMVPIRDENGHITLLSREEYRQWMRRTLHPINNPPAPPGTSSSSGGPPPTAQVVSLAATSSEDEEVPADEEASSEDEDPPVSPAATGQKDE